MDKSERLELLKELVRARKVAKCRLVHLDKRVRQLEEEPDIYEKEEKREYEEE